MPIKKIIFGYVAQRFLKRALPRVIPGGLALIVVAEVARHAVKYFVTDKKKSTSPRPFSKSTSSKNTASKKTTSKSTDYLKTARKSPKK